MIFEELHLFRSAARDEYIGSDPGIKFDTYLWDTIFAHATMANFVRYKFDDITAMYASIAQSTV